MQQTTTSGIRNFNEALRVYIRREGGRFVRMCAELQAIIDGPTFEEIVSKTKTLIARAVTNGTHPAHASVTVLVTDNDRGPRQST